MAEREWKDRSNSSTADPFQEVPVVTAQPGGQTEGYAARDSDADCTSWGHARVLSVFHDGADHKKGVLNCRKCAGEVARLLHGKCLSTGKGDPLTRRYRCGDVLVLTSHRGLHDGLQFLQCLRMAKIPVRVLPDDKATLSGDDDFAAVVDPSGCEEEEAIAACNGFLPRESGRPVVVLAQGDGHLLDPPSPDITETVAAADVIIRVIGRKLDVPNGAASDTSDDGMTMACCELCCGGDGLCEDCCGVDCVVRCCQVTCDLCLEVCCCFCQDDDSGSSSHGRRGSITSCSAPDCVIL